MKFALPVLAFLLAPVIASAAQKPQTTASLSEQAASELKLAPADISGSVMPTPATIRAKVEPVKSPIRPLAYRLGVSIQPFQPEGRMSVAGSTPYELSVLGTRPMVALEGQWLPLTFERIPRTRFGLYASLGYAQHTMDLKSPTGVAMENTQLHSMKMQGGATTSWQFPGQASKWSMNGQIGYGRWTTVQSSTSSYANQTATLTYTALAVNVERSFFNGLSGYAGYELRSVASADVDGASIPRDNVVIGFLGNFE